MNAPNAQTLTFENAHALSELYAADETLLRETESTLGVKLTARDTQLKIDGANGSVLSAQELFRQLHLAHQHGLRIRRHEFLYALKAVQRGEGKQLESIWSTRIQVSGKKPVIIPKTFLQKAYVDEIRHRDLVFGLGPAGTGKTYLAMAMAVSYLKTDKINRIILTRPAVEAGEALGFLPGDLQEKIFPYLRPLYDALYDMLDVEEIQKMMDKGILEIAPLAYMRGRTLTGAFVILDEGQNATTEQMFMFLTRLGPDSKCIVTGDPTQVDLPHHRKSGLIEAVQALTPVEGIGFVRFEDTDVIRHELVGKIVRAYKEHRGARQTSLTL
ncbi:MAG: PhoH family protein [Verrucomicrobia bacterium]|nr:PhoH family protein [Verrucomicrobiota bacterium]